jgi:thiol-disulfide isomerase/thioredoxin
MGIVVLEEQDKDGALIVTMAHPASTNRSGLSEFRPVAFDGQNNRHVLERLCGGATEQVAMYRFRLDPKKLPAEKVNRLGVEMLTPEGVRLLARQALARAKKEGVEVLPPPNVGAKYEFALTALDGRKVRSQDLRGKVVLIDCWATWCSSCMALLPDLIGLHEKWHEAGLEVVGISFDEDPAKVRKAVRALKLPWPQVLVPADEATRRLWQEAAGIGGLPRVLLIDRDGTLHADSPENLEKAVAELVKKKPSAPK